MLNEGRPPGFSPRSWNPGARPLPSSKGLEDLGESGQSKMKILKVLTVQEVPKGPTKFNLE